MTNERDRLFMILTEIAEMKGVKLGDTILGHYIKKLSDIPFEKVYDVLMATIEDNSSRLMPSINDIRQRCGFKISEVALDYQKQAQAIADRIRAAIPRFGSWNENSAIEYIGPVGFEIVKNFGGWSNVCDVKDLDFDDMIIQMRKSAEVYLMRAASGDQDKPILLPDSPKTEMIKNLASSFSLGQINH